MAIRCELNAETGIIGPERVCVWILQTSRDPRRRTVFELPEAVNMSGNKGAQQRVATNPYRQCLARKTGLECQKTRTRPAGRGIRESAYERPSRQEQITENSRKALLAAGADAGLSA